VHCAQTAEDIHTISFAYDSPKPLLDRVKIWLTLVNLFLPKFCPKGPTPGWFERRRHLMTNCQRRHTVAQWSQWRVYWNHCHSFEWYHRWPLWPPFPQNMGLKCTPRPTSQRVLPPGEYDRRYRQHLFSYDIMSRAMSPNYFSLCFYNFTALLCAILMA